MQRWLIAGFAGLALVGIVAATWVAVIWLEPSQITPIEVTHALPLHSAGSQGRIQLELERTAVEIRSAPTGAPLRIEGKYDASVFELESKYAGSPNGWSYRIRLHPTNLVHQFARQVEPVRLLLPRDTPISIRGDVGPDSDLDFGGVWIVDADFAFGRGEQHVAFTEPLPAPVRNLTLDAGFSELTLVELGNASPLHVELSKRTGHACVDLSGAWQTDAVIEVDCGLGSCDLHRPQDDQAVMRSTDPSATNLPRLELVRRGTMYRGIELTESLTSSQHPG